MHGGQCLHELREHTHVVESVAFAPESAERTLSTAGSAGSEAGGGVAARKPRANGTGGSAGVAWGEEGGEGGGRGRFMASGSRDKTVKLWNASVGQCLMTFVSAAPVAPCMSVWCVYCVSRWECWWCLRVAHGRLFSLVIVPAPATQQHQRNLTLAFRECLRSLFFSSLVCQTLLYSALGVYCRGGDGWCWWCVPDVFPVAMHTPLAHLCLVPYLVSNVPWVVHTHSSPRLSDYSTPGKVCRSVLCSRMTR